jgi:hypothetical protein
MLSGAPASANGGHGVRRDAIDRFDGPFEECDDLSTERTALRVCAAFEPSV